MTLSRSNPRAKSRWLSLFAILLFGTAMLAGTVLAAPNFAFVQDVQGANDEPGQKDLTADAAAYDLATGDFYTAWKWDDTAWSGSNTGDACSLFDTDADGNANYAVCVTIGKPAIETSTRVYSCDDTRPDRCTGSVLRGTESIDSTADWCSISQVSATFPPTTGLDTQATCNITQVEADVAAVSGLDNGTLLNSCSYPSQQPNSDPSDCVRQIANVPTTTTTQVMNTNGAAADTQIADGAHVNIGTVAYDTATLSGNTATAGGTVTYYVELGDATCSIAGATSLGVKTVTNGVPAASDTYTFASAGTYEFWAVYSGSSGNLASTSVCLTETVIVNANSSTTTQVMNTNGAAADTQIADGAHVNIGTVAYDTATLSGNTATAGGTVTYYVELGDATCSIAGATALGVKTVTNGVPAASDTYTFASAGTYEFWAVYSGDVNNNGSTSVCLTETVIVDANLNGISTAQSLVPNDSATLTGLTSGAGGTITFKLFAPSNATCSTAAEATAPVVNQTLNVTGGQSTYTTTNAVAVTTEGTYRWLVTYTGDANNGGATSACGIETFVVDNDTTN